MLVLGRSAYDAILDHAREAAPEEACGILAGERDDGDSRVTEIYRTENVAETPEVTYLIDPEEQYDVMSRIEEAGDDVLGFYHSHPAGPSGPSRTDANRATWDGYYYVIASLDGETPVLDGWIWTGDRFVMDGVTVEPAGEE